MVSQNCPAVSQNFLVNIETIVNWSFITNLKLSRLSKLLMVPQAKPQKNTGGE